MAMSQAEKQVLYQLTNSFAADPDYRGPHGVKAPGYSLIGGRRAAKQAVKNLADLGLVHVLQAPTITTAKYAVLPRDLLKWLNAGFHKLELYEIKEL